MIYESQDSGIYRTVPDRTTDAAEKSAQWAHSQSVNFIDGLYGTQNLMSVFASAPLRLLNFYDETTI